MHTVPLTSDHVDWILSVTKHRCELLGEWLTLDPSDTDLRDELAHAESVCDKMEAVERDPNTKLYPATLTDDECAWIHGWFYSRSEEIDADLEEPPFAHDEQHCLIVERAFVRSVLNVIPTHRTEVIDG